MTDGSNCGACSVACAIGVSCVSGVCQAGGAGTGGGSGAGGISGGGGISGSGGLSGGGGISGGGGMSGAAAVSGAGGASGAGGGSGAGGVGGAAAGAGGVSGASSGAGGAGTAGGGGIAGMGGAGAGGTSGAGATAGSGGTAGGCAATPTSCSAPTVRISDVTFGVNLVSNGSEGDTAAIPLAIAAKPGGGSRVAAMGSDGRVYVGELDCNDQLVGAPFSFPAHDFQDIGLDANGGVVMLTRDAQGGGTLNCGTPANLCDGGPNPAIPCYDMYLVRFNTAGAEQWAAKLTSSSASLPPYSTSKTGATVYMIWWYQHHGRLAYDGANYASYFCDAISVSEGGCINIHEGDRMKVVDPGGNLLTMHDSFDLGCSHSWNTRIVWDPAISRFITVCATDNNNRIVRSPGYQTIFSSQDIGSLSLGNIVLANGGGYWVSVSDQGTIRLLRFTSTTSTPNLTVSAGSSGFSHLVTYGPNHMLLSWESGSTMAAQVRSSADGSAVGAQLSIGVSDHRYQDWKAFPDGSVAYAARGSGSQSIRIARVMPCSG